MRSSRAMWVSSVLIALLFMAAQSALAQASRTWVSGVGDDANPCSRTAPCKTLEGAFLKTATGGEIDILDPGGFGAVTITKSISIEADGNFGGVLTSGTNGITIAAGPSDNVVIRGLTIEGLGSSLNGIRFTSGGSLTVESCTIDGFGASGGSGIDFEPTGSSQLFVKDTVIRNTGFTGGGGAVYIQPSGSGSAEASLESVRMENDHFGLQVGGNSRVMVRDSSASGNAVNGFTALSPSAAAIAEITLEGSSASNNGFTGVRAVGVGAIIRMSNTTVSGNARGIKGASGGTLVSFGNNHVAGNGNDGSPTTTISDE